MTTAELKKKDRKMSQVLMKSNTPDYLFNKMLPWAPGGLSRLVADRGILLDLIHLITTNGWKCKDGLAVRFNYRLELGEMSGEIYPFVVYILTLEVSDSLRVIASDRYKIKGIQRQ